MRTLRDVFKAIEAEPRLGLRASIEKSYSSTDNKPRGCRYITRVGKGRYGLRLTVVLIKTGETVCRIDTSETYTRASEAVEWLTEWKRGRRRYCRCGPCDRFVVG